jgi:hypothetical protein
MTGVNGFGAQRFRAKRLIKTTAVLVKTPPLRWRCNCEYYNVNDDDNNNTIY